MRGTGRDISKIKHKKSEEREGEGECRVQVGQEDVGDDER